MNDKKKGIKEKGLENYYSVDETAFAWECIFSLKAGKQKTNVQLV